MNWLNMEDCLGLSRQELQEVLEIFLETADADCIAMQEGITGSDPVKVAEGAHSIKGAAINLGFLEIGEGAGRIEKKARSANLAGVREDVQFLREILEEVALIVRQGSEQHEPHGTALLQDSVTRGLSE